MIGFLRFVFIGLFLFGFSNLVFSQYYDTSIQAGSKDHVVTYWYSVKTDCTAGVMPTVVITQQPTHGTAVIALGRNFPRFWADSKYFHCNGQLVSSVQLRYTPQPGFVGTDYMTTHTMFHSGQYNTHTYIITVTKGPPPGGENPPSMRKPTSR
jgi:hypothetical protein